MFARVARWEGEEAEAMRRAAEDLRRGDEALNSMNPPEEGIGRRNPVEVYEVAVDVRT